MTSTYEKIAHSVRRKEKEMVFEEVQKIIADKLAMDPMDIQMDSKLDDDLEADSLDVLDIIMAVEETFDIQIPQEDLVEMEKVADLVSYIESVS